MIKRQDLWGRCKAIEEQFWADNEVRNTQMKKRLLQEKAEEV
ncbi:hypothetical protein [Endozoicomonas sp. SCSIO W0465]|nr:hypothetical protein [Endozoicomonas sp. SCSIO W0465]